MTDNLRLDHEPVSACFLELKKVTLKREARYTEDPNAAAPQGPQSTVEVAIRSVGFEIQFMMVFKYIEIQKEN